METEISKSTPILDVAWRRIAQLDSTALKRSSGHYQTRRWIAVLGVLATLFAILTQLYTPLLRDAYPFLARIAQALFIATPFAASTLAAIASKKFANGDWLITRAAVEEIKKEIYYYRTILQKRKNRRDHLEKRLAEIQRQVYRALNGEFSFEDYDGPLPRRYRPDDPTSDPGFSDLTGEQYFKYRLENQLNWHNRKINQYKTERDRLMVLVLIAGALGSILATLGGAFSIWVALTASITTALLGWQELRNIDVIVRNYSKVVLELTVLKDHWLNLEPEERTDAEFYKMVRDCEEVLWAQNTEYIKTMQEALKDRDLDEEASLVNNVVRESVQAAERTKQAMNEDYFQITQETLDETGQKVNETFRAILGSLAEDASSELVQQELDAMIRAATETDQEYMEQDSAAFSSQLSHIAQEFSHVDVGRDTSKEELNQILAHYPKTGDVKG